MKAGRCCATPLKKLDGGTCWGLQTSGQSEETGEGLGAAGPPWREVPPEHKGTVCGINGAQAQYLGSSHAGVDRQEPAWGMGGSLVPRRCTRRAWLSLRPDADAGACMADWLGRVLVAMRPCPWRVYLSKAV
ncbi:hypothetical protein NDU88_006161 [Pleurodeles waltl]|uniref:Uncharacterized protein n=1 Tax=Pleurodeles waltl TaxID=8319 RepID=A0AAV7QGV0_PLEWA|nr:hypothetical protein NDU88_006161 [Pleurodeles waltl]